jgi:hypothetical protein
MWTDGQTQHSVIRSFYIILLRVKNATQLNVNMSISTKVVYFSKFHYRTKFQDPVLSIAPMSFWCH